ncbi:MAG: phosphomethylpyrimidine synthase ThiC [bacterium]
MNKSDILQIVEARRGNLTDEVRSVASVEGISPETIMKSVADGTVVIPRSRRHQMSRLCGIGKGLRTKVNANIGTSMDVADESREHEKLAAALDALADTVMDLSTGGDLTAIRRKILAACPVPLGTVPIYQAAIQRAKAGGGIGSMTADEMFTAIEEHGKDGVDFITVHCGVTLASLERLKQEGRILDVVSRGGAFLVTWMIANGKENPLYSDFDRLVEIAARYDMTLSLGDGMRPGCLADANDRAQFQELITLGELQTYAFGEGVQVMIEGPGHVPLGKIEENIRLEKEICHGAPFYVLGPLVTDVAPGYDHVTSAIGGAIAASAGADYLCYVTSTEHLGLPGPEDVREGVITTRIAAHAADIAKGIRGAADWDLAMAGKRKKRDWEGMIDLSLDKRKAESIHAASPSRSSDVCTMCGDYCSIKLVEEYFKKEVHGR